MTYTTSWLTIQYFHHWLANNPLFNPQNSILGFALDNLQSLGKKNNMKENLYNLPPDGTLDIAAFQRAMDTAKFTASYKPFWFLAIMNLLQKEYDVNGGVRLKMSDIARRMLVLAWVPSVYYRLSFGSSDKLGESVSEIADSVKLDRTVGSYDEIQRIVDGYCLNHPNLPKHFLRYVPQCFLNYNSNQVKKASETISKYNSISDNMNETNMYVIDNDEIKISADWCRYLTRNSQILIGWAKYSLTRYFEKRNPNVPAIASKLDLEGDRNLLTQRKLWTAFLSDNKVYDFISGERVTSGYDLDHYIPWAFVQHNQLWNLSPLTKQSNAKKSDSLPNWDSTFGRFSETQHAFYSFVLNNKKEKLLEDYLTVLNNLVPFSRSEFVSSIENHIHPLWQIAKNMGW